MTMNTSTQNAERSRLRYLSERKGNKPRVQSPKPSKKMSSLLSNLTKELNK